ncbi:hypothetical protein [Bradyrhizobium sp.]|nr:hypothetical protein [Bradyrhizobium sp.]
MRKIDRFWLNKIDRIWLDVLACPIWRAILHFFNGFKACPELTGRN